jgi:hypothetical protein
MKITQSIFAIATIAVVAFILNVSACKKEIDNNGQQESIESANAMNNALRSMAPYTIQ